MKNTVIPIFFSVDDRYAPYLDVALTSIIRNASKEYDYRIIVIYKELNDKNRERLSSRSNEHFEIQFVPMENRLEDITDRMANRLRADYFTLTIYFRLFIPEMFPEYDKGIYLDSDIVVPGDISTLFHVELADNFFAASRDHSIAHIPQLITYIENAIGVKKEQYINSGVLLMNLKKMREVKLGDRFLELLNRYHFDCIAPDQDYLNVMCHEKILYLPISWDAMPVEGKESMAHPNLIHYNLFSKPWCYDGIPYEEHFWEYAKDSDYIAEILHFKSNYGEENKKSDSEHLQLLLDRAVQIAKSEENFRTVFSGGKERRL